MLIRLKETGHFDETKGEAKADLSSLDKPCMLVYTGKFQSMDGEVEIKDEDIETLASNHNSLFKRLSRMVGGEVHPKYNPPIQLDHSTSARDTVGRLVGEVKVGEHEIDGKKVKALMGTTRILGKENVERVMDGRWTHLSIGADLEKHSISELTITPFPAAADASLLAKTHLGSAKKESSYKDFTYYIADTGEGTSTRYETGIQWDSGSGWYFEKGFPTEAEAVAYAKKMIDKELKLRPDEYKLADGKKKPVKMANVAKKLDYNGSKVEIHEVDGMYHTEVDEQLLDEQMPDLAAAEDYAKKHVDVKTKDESKLKAGEGQGDDDMSKKKLSYKDAKEQVAMYEKCKKHLMDKEQLSEEAAEGRMSNLSDEDVSKMAGDRDEEDKKLAAEDEKKKAEEKDRMSKMAGSKEKLVKLTKGFRENAGKVALTQAKAAIKIRLAKLQSEAKVSPAEVKALNLDELAGKTKEVIEATLASYEKRQPVIDTGVIGSTKAMTAAQLHASLTKLNLSKEELQTRLNMPMKAEEARKQLSELAKQETELTAALSKVELAGGDTGVDEVFTNLEALFKDGKKDEAKAKLRAFVASQKMSAAHVGDNTAEMSALAEQVKTMQAEFNELVNLAGPAFGATAEELA